MARVLADTTTSVFDKKYPWTTWLDGQAWELTPGEDFLLSVFNMRAMAYGAATRKGLKVRTADRNGKLIIQAYKPE